MPITRRLRLPTAFALVLLLGACASTPSTANAPPDDASLLANAIATVRKQPNGDEVTEYRVAGQLRAVRVVPLRGRPYTLYDRNADGRVDEDQNISPVYFKLFEW